MALPPCTTGKHSSAPRVNPAAPQKNSQAEPSPVVTSVSKDGIETYGTAVPTAKLPAAESSKVSVSDTATAASSFSPSALTAITLSEPKMEEKEVKEEEQDDLSVPVPDGARCKRLACGATWEGEQVSRGEGEKAVCRHHPQPVRLTFFSLSSCVSNADKRAYGTGDIPRRFKRLLVLQATSA